MIPTTLEQMPEFRQLPGMFASCLRIGTRCANRNHHRHRHVSKSDLFAKLMQMPVS